MPGARRSSPFVELWKLYDNSPMSKNLHMIKFRHSFKYLIIEHLRFEKTSTQILHYSNMNLIFKAKVTNFTQDSNPNEPIRMNAKIWRCLASINVRNLKQRKVTLRCLTWNFTTNTFSQEVTEELKCSNKKLVHCLQDNFPSSIYYFMHLSHIVKYCWTN